MNKLLWKEALTKEIGSPEMVYWLSFCDPKKPKGTQFIGVIITKAIGAAHAIEKSHQLGINPGGEVLSYPPGDQNINSNLFDRLLTVSELKKNDLI
jgi:hypothetical protein